MEFDWNEWNEAVRRHHKPKFGVRLLDDAKDMPVVVDVEVDGDFEVVGNLSARLTEANLSYVLYQFQDG